ncbi:MAG: dethiobiotin synthase [Chlamydiae bacterium]|nr:dethiobiotin synthase [Chlamydiota bacterium]MBI3267339.1 dethiobiotin synthase [Chlamydiota bacterium]
MKKGFFVTGTDTGVGKTLVSCVLARILGRWGSVGVMKPFASGNRQDALRLQGAARRDDLTLDEVNPIYFKEPLAPYSARGFGKKAIDLKKVLKSYQRISASSDFMIVEGIGGLHVPLSGVLDVADLVLKLNLPLLIVTHLRLGTLNHTLLTVDYARQKGLQIKGLIFCESRVAKDWASKTNPQALQRLTQLPLLGHIPCLKGRFGEKVEKAVRENFISLKWLRKWDVE